MELARLGFLGTCKEADLMVSNGHIKAVDLKHYRPGSGGTAASVSQFSEASGYIISCCRSLQFWADDRNILLIKCQM